MQVNATILAAQQAAREARAALVAPKPQPAASFLTELNAVDAPSAAPKAAAPTIQQTAAPQAPMRPGSLVNIVI